MCLLIECLPVFQTLCRMIAIVLIDKTESTSLICFKVLGIPVPNNLSGLHLQISTITEMFFVRFEKLLFSLQSLPIQNGKYYLYNITKCRQYKII